ncbi:hypothetical protein GQR58_008856 [Nymphon striatum]|nr:hypothetical protein GQR58_008856 [Nymphon striatum]
MAFAINSTFATYKLFTKALTLYESTNSYELGLSHLDDLPTLEVRYLPGQIYEDYDLLYWKIPFLGATEKESYVFFEVNQFDGLLNQTYCIKFAYHQLKNVKNSNYLVNGLNSIKKALSRKTSFLRIKYKYNAWKKILFVKILKKFNGYSSIYLYKKKENDILCDTVEETPVFKFINLSGESIVPVYFENVNPAWYCILNETSATFDGLKPGNYCFRVEPFIPHCDECYMVKYTRIISIIGILQGFYDQSLSASIQSINADHDKKNVSVLLVYTEDCDLHLKVIESFISLLQSIGCKVYHPSEPECRAYIQLDPVNWFRKLVFREKIDDRNHKIIWVASEMACLRFDAHLIENFDNPYRMLDDSIDFYYELCSRMIVDKINEKFTENVYSHIAIVKLPYYQGNPNTLTGILPDQRYELPSMLNQLYEFLYDKSPCLPVFFEENLSVTSLNPIISNFVKSIDNMTLYVNENPNAIYNKWMQKLS